MTPEERIKAQSDFKKTLVDMTEEQLNALAATLIEESKELDETVSKTEYKLPTKGQKDAFEAIKYFLNTQKVKWNYALGIITLYEYFDQAQKTITFAMLDTVLRLLGSLEYTGYDEWKKVSLVNDYFTPVAVDYRDLTDKIYDLGERYAAVDGQLKMFAPVEDAPQTEA